MEVAVVVVQGAAGVEIGAGTGKMDSEGLGRKGVQIITGAMLGNLRTNSTWCKQDDK